MPGSVGTQSCAENCGATLSTEAHTVGLLMSYAHVCVCTFLNEEKLPFIFKRCRDVWFLLGPGEAPRKTGWDLGGWVKPCRGRIECVVPAAVVLQGPHSVSVLGFATGVVSAEWRTWSRASSLLLGVLVGKWVSTCWHFSVKIRSYWRKHSITSQIHFHLVE